MKASSFAWILAALVAVTGASAQEKPAVPFHMPVPDGWRTETIVMPPEFAKDMSYEGLEELRFAPGMFEPTEPDFWSYVFVWWVPHGSDLSEGVIGENLYLYFEGLAYAVAHAEEFDPKNPQFAVDLQPREEGGFEGTVQAYDAFATRESVFLNVTVDVTDCAAQKHTALFFSFSPQPMTHEIWQDMKSISDGFKCGS